jgi:hypothetical protein
MAYIFFKLASGIPNFRTNEKRAYQNSQQMKQSANMAIGNYLASRGSMQLQRYNICQWLRGVSTCNNKRNPGETTVSALCNTNGIITDLAA